MLSRKEYIYDIYDVYGAELLMSPPRGKKINLEAFFRTCPEELDISLFKTHVIASARDPELEGKLIFINIKPRTLARFYNEVVRYAGERVVLELREDVAMRELEDEIERIRKEHGLKIAVDDFGVGGSNYDRIARLCPEFVKVDMSVLNDLAFYNVVKTLKNVCPSTLIIAEKVETEKDFELVVSSGVHLWQGWYAKKLFGEKINASG